ncbi:MAG: GUN4 domain-containing protein [Synechocystis sp.]
MPDFPPPEGQSNQDGNAVNPLGSSVPESPADQPDVTQKIQVLTQQLQALSQQIQKIENQLVLVPDIERYGRLQELLMAGDYKGADFATTQIILDTLNKSRDTLNPETLSALPCTVLTVIDRLWRTYSQGRFGFSVQLAAYQKVGGSLDTLRTQDRKVMGAFAQQVGWLVEGKLRFEEYDQWDFSLNAPAGIFPAIWWKSPYGLKMVTFFFIRLLDCRIQ